MHFRDGANKRMMDEFIHGEARDKKRETGIEAVKPSNGKPGGSKVLGGLCAVERTCGTSLSTPQNAFGLVCSGEFDDISDKEVTRDE